MEAAQARLSLNLSKCHSVGKHMSQIIIWAVAGEKPDFVANKTTKEVNFRICCLITKHTMYGFIFILVSNEMVNTGNHVTMLISVSFVSQ